MNLECKNEEEDGKAKLLILLILLSVAAVTGILLISKERCDKNRVRTPVLPEQVSVGVGLVIDPNAENSPTYGNDKISEQGVMIAGWESITIPANKKEVTVDFFNPKENEKLYYLTFELRLYDSEAQNYEVLYASGLVEPGKHINRITLSRALEKGVYEAVIHVQPHRMNEEKTLTNNADMEIKLIVD